MHQKNSSKNVSTRISGISLRDNQNEGHLPLLKEEWIYRPPLVGSEISGDNIELRLWRHTSHFEKVIMMSQSFYLDES